MTAVDRWAERGDRAGEGDEWPPAEPPLTKDCIRAAAYYRDAARRGQEEAAAYLARAVRADTANVRSNLLYAARASLFHAIELRTLAYGIEMVPPRRRRRDAAP